MVYQIKVQVKLHVLLVLRMELLIPVGVRVKFYETLFLQWNLTYHFVVAILHVPASQSKTSCTFDLRNKLSIPLVFDSNFLYFLFLGVKFHVPFSQRQTSHTLGLRMKLHVLSHLIVKFHLLLVSEWNFKYPHSLGEAWYTPWFWSEVHDRHLLFCSNYNGWFICSMWWRFQSEVCSQSEAPYQHQGLWVQVSCHLQLARIVQ